MELTPVLHRGLSADPIAPHVSFSFNSDASCTKAKWATAGNGLPSHGLLQASPSESNKTYPQKLMLNNMHSAAPFSQHDFVRVGCDIFRLGRDLHVLPPRKLRKLLTTFSDGVHVFSCVEKVNMPICADFVWPLNGSDDMHSYLGKKRPWQFCYGGNEQIDVNTGFFGGRIPSQAPVISHDQDHFCPHASGSGGDSDGRGSAEGGGGYGGDGGGSQQPDFDGEEMPIAMNWHAFAEEHEDRTMQGKTGTDDRDMSENLFGSENGTTLKNGSHVVVENPQSENIHKEACSMHGASHEILNRILGDLDRFLSQFSPECKRAVHHGEGKPKLMGQYNVHQSVGDTALAYDHTELQDDLQGIDLALADYDCTADGKGNLNNLLEKLRGLTLGFVGHTRDTQVVNPIQLDRLNGGNPSFFQKNLVSDDKTSSSSKAEEGSKLLGGKLQGVVDWLDHLAESVSGKHTLNHERPDYQVEDQKLRTLVNEAVATALKQLSDADGAPAPAKQADTETLKRLQRDVFSELLKLREKLDQVASARHSDNAKHFSGGGKTNLQGEVKVGTAFVLLEDSSSRHSRGSLEQAGMQTGVDVKLTFETSFREKDLLITEFIAGQCSSVGEGRGLGGPMSLGKVQYLVHVNDGISVSFVPMGACGMDVTDIVNPVQDQGLTSFSSRGPALFDHCRGSAIGATWSGSSFALSAAHYLSGWGNQMFSLGTDTRESGPLCLSTLGQLLLQPTERLIFSLSGLNRFWPSPPLPSSMGLHWSEMGPLVIPKIHSLQTSRSTMSSEESFASHCNSVSSPWGMFESEYNLDAPQSKGTSQLSVAAAAEIEISENLSVGAWAQVDDALQDLDKGNFQWALNLAKTSKNGIAWGASIGGSKPDVWSILTSEQEMYPGFVGDVGDSQLHLEAFARLNCGKGFTLQPGLLYLLNKHSRTPAFIVRSSWLF